MTGEDVLNVVRQLAANNGSYCRMLERLESADGEARAEWLKQFESCVSAFDVVRKVEGW